MLSQLLTFLFIAAIAHATPEGAVEDENFTRGFELSFQQGLRGPLEPFLYSEHEIHLVMDAAENLLAAGDRSPLEALTYGFLWQHLPPKEQARWFRLTRFAREEDLAASLSWARPDSGLLYELLLLEPSLRTPEMRTQAARFENAFPQETLALRGLESPAWSPPSPRLVRGLFSFATDVAHFQNGAYANKPRIFLFCRHDRVYPCLIAMKDRNDTPVRDGKKLWTQPGLGLSGYGKPFNERLGNTPQGVHLVDSVIPEANNLEDFGRFRRMILEFPSASPDETEMRRLLPASAAAADWWREAAIARDVGRSELRIHGTGTRNPYPTSPSYPFVATIGCVSQREMKYGDVDYIDQRHLLDRLMQAQGLEPRFDNEPSIRALLYVIDIDDRHGAVTAGDLARFGIE